MKTQTIRQRLLHSTMIGGVAVMAAVAIPAAAMLMPTEALAQSQTGGLRVQIQGEGGQPLAGATVTARSPNSLVTRSGVTDANGFVRLSGLDPATNYTVTVSAPGYADFSTSADVAVVSGQDRSVGYALGTTSVDDIIVTGTSLAAIDTTSATVGTTLTLDVVESLPTGRSYQSYLQLVPGTKPGSNPSSKSGINSSVTGVTGSSSDNIYVFDGVNVTDPVTGTFAANLNNEIIQEQQVLTGGIPAEYEGGSGLVSRVVTKSGGNDWTGSVNYYMQTDALVQRDEHAESAGFSTYDTAVTLGGPLLRDRLWFFGSYQVTHREDDVLNPSTGALQRTVERDGEYAFAKLTWQITQDDRLTATYMTDPLDISGSATASVRNYRDTAQTQGGERWKVDYTRNWGDLTLNAYYFNHESELNTVAADSSTRNNVVFRIGDTYTYEQQNIGGAGGNTLRNRNREEWGVNAEYFLDTSFGSHTFKAGYVNNTTASIVEGTVNGGATYTSIASQYSGSTFAQLIAPSTPGNPAFQSAVFSADDRTRIRSGLLAPGNAAARAIVDTNADGTISDAEIDAIRFNNTTGNPGGQVNVYRSLRTQNGVNDLGSEGQAFYLQDTWTMGQLTINAGVRAEEWTHFDSNGDELFTFEWELAPRLSAVYDLFGDGRSKVWAFAGRYYDPIRNDMTGFAGSFSGAVDEEQINVGGNWVTYRTRGGTAVIDSIFSPSTKTPYTDEFILGYATTFGRDIGLSVTATKRDTRQIFEDYDLHVYSDPSNTGTDGNAVPGGPFFLDYDYFGLSTQQIADVQAGNINYVLGTLAGGKRDYWGVEVALTKYRTDNWFGQVSYTYNNAEGNTSSDGNAGVQGDFIYLDPRAPNAYGKLPGNIEHQFKAYAAYEFDFGLEIAGVFNWNSGRVYTPISYLYGYVAGPRDPAYNVGGTVSTWLSPGYTGAETTPAYYTLDARATYTVDMPVGEVELFLDIFNVLNDQAATSVYTDLGGSATYAYQEPNSWVAPRRAYLGIRYSF